MIPTAAVSASTTYLHADPKLAAWVAAEDDLRQYMQNLTCRYVDKMIYMGKSGLTNSGRSRLAKGFSRGSISRTLSDYVRINMICNA